MEGSGGEEKGGTATAEEGVRRWPGGAVTPACSTPGWSGLRGALGAGWDGPTVSSLSSGGSDCPPLHLTREPGLRLRLLLPTRVAASYLL